MPNFNKEGDAVNMPSIHKDNTAPLDSRMFKENPNLIPRGIFVEKV